MGSRTAPALPFAVAFLLGTAVAFHARAPSVGLAALLTAGGLACRPRLAAPLAGLGLGLLLTWGRVPVGMPGPDPSRPVVLVGGLADAWAREAAPDPGWAGTLWADRFRQRDRVALWGEPVRVVLPGEEPPPPGPRLRLTGYLRRSAGFANVPAVAGGPWRLRVKSRVFVVPEAASPGVAGLSRRLRRPVAAALATAGEGPGGIFARALVLGDGKAVPMAWRRGLRRAGLAHLLSVSGLHLGLVAGAVLLAGAWLPRRTRLLAALTAVAFYLLLVGPRASVLRAALMALLALGALLLERQPQAPSALAWAAVLLVLAEPRVVGDLGFRLTVTATAGLLFLGPALERRWGDAVTAADAGGRRGGAKGAGRGDRARRALAATIAAQLATLPFALPAFHLLTPLAPLWNLLAIPWTGLFLTAALAWTAVTVALPAAGSLFAPALDALAAPLTWPAGVPQRLAFPVPLVAGGAAALGLSIALAVLAARPRLGAGLLLPVLAGLTCRPAPALPELVLLDVGQGDAVLLRDGRRALLVDGGGWRDGDLGGRVLVPALAGLGVRRLDAVVLTHPDLDHCAGLVDLIAYLPVGEVWTAVGWRRDDCVRELLLAPGVALRPLWAGERARLGAWRLTVLHPPPGERGGGNERSVVLRAEADGHRVLLTGDLGAPGEARLLARHPVEELAAGVLKVGHHGSKGATSGAFLDVVKPRLALISAGPGNLYGHPSPVVLDRLARRGVRALSTDRAGMIRVELRPGGRLRIQTPGSPR